MYKTRLGYSDKFINVLRNELSAANYSYVYFRN